MEKNRVAKVVIIIAVLAVILGIFILKGQKEEQGKDLTFKDAFYTLKDIDEKYNTSFHTEYLNVSMVPLDKIPLMIADIKEFEGALNKKSASRDMPGVFLFIDIRKLMLTSQWYLQQAKAIGDMGLVNDEEGFSCSENKYIIDAAFLYNETFIYGLQAEEEIDDLLYMYKNRQDVWDLVGVDDNKTQFFRSDLKHIRHIPINNLKSLETYCGISGIKHETTYTPFQYERKLMY